MVKGPDKKYVVKATKTIDGTRDIYIPDYLVSLIQKQGYIYNGNPDRILKTVYRHALDDKIHDKF